MAGLLQLRDHFDADDVVVVIFHDHGSRYLGKMFNDDWMREKGFLEKTGMTARDLVASGLSGELLRDRRARAGRDRREADERARFLADLDHPRQAPGRVAQRVAPLRTSWSRDPDIKQQPVETIMQPAFPFVDISTPVDLLSTMITPQNPAVLVRDFKTDKTFIITRSDVIRVL